MLLFLSLCTSAFQLPGQRASTCFCRQPELQAVCVLSFISELLSSAAGQTTLDTSMGVDIPWVTLPADSASRRGWKAEVGKGWRREM